MELAHPALFLIDGANLAYRSHFAMIRTPLITSWGANASALFGFVNALLRLVKDVKPEYIVVVNDPPGSTFRHEMYSGYKATRQKMPDDLRAQYPVLDEMVAALGVRTVMVEKYEADDVIGTLAKLAEAAGVHAYIVSGDKDMAQLVSERISIYNTAKQDVEVELLDSAAVREKFGVPPARIVDFLALQGDSSDNIPGIAGVGPKAAIQLIEQYATLDELVEKREQVKLKKAREALIADPNVVLLSRQLATIKTDVPVELVLTDLAPAPPDKTKLRELFQRFEFKVLLKEFTDDQSSDEHNYRVLMTPEELEEVLPRLVGADLLVVGAATAPGDNSSGRGADPLGDRLVGISFSVAPREAFYVPLALQGGTESNRRMIELIKPLLQDETLPKAGQNVKHDLLVFENHGIKFRGIAFDTMIASFLIDPGARDHGLDAMAIQHLGYKKIPREDLVGKRGKGQLSMLDVDVDLVGNYSAEDVDLTRRVTEVFRPRIVELGLEPLMRDIELPLVPVLATMERTGVKLDLPFLAQLSQSMRAQSAALEADIVAICGGESFNLSSPKQLGIILFDKLEIHNDLKKRKPKKTKTGSYTTDAKTLESFGDHPVIRKLLDHRQLQKLMGTYVDALPELVRPETGRVHTSFNQTNAITGRLSSVDPNLQNIPIRTEMGREIRKAFIPANPDDVLLSADYSQIELRIMAHLSGDASLIAAFESNEDVHSRTAQLMFNVKPEDVTREMRNRAKTINFGILYGMNEYGLASRMAIPIDEAKAFIADYFSKLPGVKEYLDRTIEHALRDGFVTTILGRRREIPEIHARDFRVRQAAENMAVNTPLQGSAADLIKKAMIAVHRRLAAEAPSARMILQVHDELVFELKESELADAMSLIRAEMESAFDLRVPLKVDMGHGKNWLEAH